MVVRFAKYNYWMVVTAALLLLNSCRKKNDLDITVYNYTLGEPIADAEVVILQVKYRGGLFNASGDCKEIAQAKTDIEGKCRFNNIRLKTTSSVQYAAKVKYAYGKAETYNCNVTENSEIKKRSNNYLVLNASSYECYFKIKKNSHIELLLDNLRTINRHITLKDSENVHSFFNALCI